MKVTIITVCYNSVKTIEKTIQSVQLQAYEDLEYIIIDGGSTDGTLDIIDAYKNDVSLCISEPDNGIYDAMNKGIRHATGDIIGIINSDDWYEADTVRRVAAYFKGNEVDVVYGKILVVDTRGVVKAPDERPLNTLWYQMAAPHPSVFIKRNIYEKYGLFDTRYKISADYELLLRLYSKGVRFGFMNRVMAYFRSGGACDIHRKLGKEEGYEIAFRYIGACENREMIFPLLNREKQWFNFEIRIVQDPFFMQELLYKYFNSDIDEIVIFGTGEWGKRCCRALQNSNIEVAFFVDNRAQEYQKIDGKTVKTTSGLKYLEQYILVAVKDSEDIVRQLDELDMKKYVTIERLLDSSLNLVGNICK